MRTTPEFSLVFAALREILVRQTGRLGVAEDSASRFCLAGGVHPKSRMPMPVAWVAIGKNYVSFHHMGIYARPELLKTVSRKLKSRMQGKSCFNLTAVDPQLLAELEDLSRAGFDAFRKAGFLPEGS